MYGLVTPEPVFIMHLLSIDHKSPRPVELAAIFLTRLASEDSPAMRLEAEAEGACGYGSSTIND